MSSVLGNAASAFAKNKAQNVRDTISDSMSKVDWEDYNYPPCLQVIHYQLSDVEDEVAKKAVWYAHIAYVSAVGVFALNLFVNFVLAVGGVEDKGVHFVYSLFNAIIFSILGMYSFFHAYKGLATRNLRLSVRYIAIQIPVLVFIFLCMLLGTVNYNGWLNLRRAEDAKESMKGFWVAMTVIESLLWMAVLGVTGFAYWLVHSKRTMGRSGGGSSSTATGLSL